MYSAVASENTQTQELEDHLDVGRGRAGFTPEQVSSLTQGRLVYRDRVFGLWEEAGEPGENMQVHPERRS